MTEAQQTEGQDEGVWWSVLAWDYVEAGRADCARESTR